MHRDNALHDVCEACTEERQVARLDQRIQLVIRNRIVSRDNSSAQKFQLEIDEACNKTIRPVFRNPDFIVRLLSEVSGSNVPQLFDELLAFVFEDSLAMTTIDARRTFIPSLFQVWCSPRFSCILI